MLGADASRAAVDSPRFHAGQDSTVFAASSTALQNSLFSGVLKSLFTVIGFSIFLVENVLESSESMGLSLEVRGGLHEYARVRQTPIEIPSFSGGSVFAYSLRTVSK